MKKTVEISIDRLITEFQPALELLSKLESKKLVGTIAFNVNQVRKARHTFEMMKFEIHKRFCDLDSNGLVLREQHPDGRVVSKFKNQDAQNEASKEIEAIYQNKLPVLLDLITITQAESIKGITGNIIAGCGWMIDDPDLIEDSLELPEYGAIVAKPNIVQPGQQMAPPPMQPIM